jgi:hypothetical protein
LEAWKIAKRPGLKRAFLPAQHLLADYISLEKETLLYYQLV